MPEQRPSEPKIVEAEAELVSSVDGAKASGAAIDRRDEPPVVARLVIEIRSDGTRTIARGAAEDAIAGEKVAVEAEGATPLALAMSLAKSLVTLPALAKTTFRAMLPGKKPKG